MIADRVQETTTTTGTGTLDLGGADLGYQSFVDGIGDGNTCYYCIQYLTADEWEVGIGTVTDAATDTLSRDTVLQSSNADALVNFSAGTKDVFVVHPAEKTLYRDANGTVAIEDANSNTAIYRAGSTAFGYEIWRDNLTGMLQFQGDQAGFTGYQFLSDDDSLLLDIQDDGTIEIPGDTLWTGADSGIPYAGIYVKDSIATISVDQDNADTLVTQWTNNSPSNNCTPDQANNKITITKAGVYCVDFHASVVLSGGATVSLRLEGYLDGVIQANLHAHRTISTTNVGSMSFGSYIDVTSVPVDLDVRANINSSTARLLTVEDAQLNVRMVGGT
jgi:hypothetical protein